MRFATLVGIGVLASIVALGGRAVADAPTGHDFLDDARTLMVVGACADGPEYTAAKDIVAAHCKLVHAAQDDYKRDWIAPAQEFFAAHVPATVPKVVVYPFAGGDLSTALTVFPDADEITTLSLEPAGDPVALAHLTPAQLKSSLAIVAKELAFLYKANFSVTMHMVGAMRGGQLPTQLIFSLSALTLHGYELTGLRYFKITPDGDVAYLTDDDIAKIDKTAKSVARRNLAYSNVELRFHKVGATREQVYRHIMANVDDQNLKSSPGTLRHLEKKGTVAAMTKAASYLLTHEDFHLLRKYLIDHVDWMVSDTTGLPPKYGKPAGFEYETWGQFDAPSMPIGDPVAPQWKQEFAAQPKRELTFKFGYPDKHLHGHLMIMRKAKPAP
jgi:hypothetical protein